MLFSFYKNIFSKHAKIFIGFEYAWQCWLALIIIIDNNLTFKYFQVGIWTLSHIYLYIQRRKIWIWLFRLDEYTIVQTAHLNDDVTTFFATQSMLYAHVAISRTLDWLKPRFLNFAKYFVIVAWAECKFQRRQWEREREREKGEEGLIYLWKSTRKRVTTLSRIIIKRSWIYYTLKLGKRFNYANGL